MPPTSKVAGATSKTELAKSVLLESPPPPLPQPSANRNATVNVVTRNMNAILVLKLFTMT